MSTYFRVDFPLAKQRPLVLSPTYAAKHCFLATGGRAKGVWLAHQVTGVHLEHFWHRMTVNCLSTHGQDTIYSLLELGEGRKSWELILH